MRGAKAGGAMVGSIKDLADQLEQWFVERACDGFVVAATHLPSAFEDFVRLVILEQQRRGLYHRDYGGLTLRKNLGRGLPQPGRWR
jgi:alkanesulfonate monooxygenase SsuD/methylene tetrahydromethanopterin reductase-like flavin-dependent oxidoreductase (luciferase family)